jgi:hypothetical protein
MKRKIILSLTLLMMVISCEGPETTVINFVRRDGSVLRKAELKNTKNELNLSDFRVPVDSTWKLHDSISISDRGDTTWFLLAEKLFESTDDINKSYLADTATNSVVPRSASHQLSFKWFTTCWRFSEKCGKSLTHGFPAERFLTPEENEFRKLPSVIREEMLAGADSLKYKTLSDSLDAHTEIWLIRSFVSEWIGDVSTLCAAAGKDTTVAETLRSHATEFDSSALADEGFDKTCAEILGDSVFQKAKPELDSAMKISEKKFDLSLSFKSYTMKTVLPLKVRSSNGYIMPGGEIAWPVNGDLFLTDDYVMWAETREVNYWAIFLTALVLFIIPLEIRNRTRKRKSNT